jgi:hypothetical protein
MMRRTVLGAVAAAAAGAGWLGWTRLSGARTLDDAAMAALYARPLAPPAGPMRVYHLGHSLVGRDMPRMLGALADAAMGPGHGWESQLGWGASLKDHWGGRAKVKGFDVENAHPRHRPAEAALASGDYDAVVFTEMVELRDALRWHDSPEYLARWARRARAGRRDVRLYLYTTWHHLDDAAGFLERIDADQTALWEDALLRPALARLPGVAIHVIPGGPALAAVVRMAEGAGGAGGPARPLGPLPSRA